MQTDSFLAISTISSTRPPLCGAASSLVGGRSENQDNMAWASTELGFIVVVCDGMGGGPGGHTASAVAMQTVIQTVANYSSSAFIEPAKCLRIAISQAEEALEAAMRADVSLTGMGTTLIALLLNENSAIVAHIGDSRIYRLHGNAMLMRTHDHSLVAELVSRKALTEEQARCSPQSNIITRGLGCVTNHTPEIMEVPYCVGDRFVLCTDGVWGMMPHDELLQRFTVKANLTTIVENLQAEIDRRGASTGGQHDNHTLVIIETTSNSKLNDKMSNQLKILIATLTLLLLFSVVSNGIMIRRLTQSSAQSANELAQATNELVNTKQLANAQGMVMNETTEEYETRIYALESSVAVLEGEKEVLESEYQVLSDRYDSLLLALQVANKRVEMAGKSANISTTNTASNQFETLATTPQQLAGEIMSELKAMKDCHSKGDYRIAAKNQGISSEKLRKKLLELDKITNRQYSNAIQELRSHLGNKNSTFRLIDKPDAKGYCHPTKAAKDDIDMMINKFKTIQDKINQQ